MSQWYNADFEDLDWVQAPPKAFNNDRKNCRKDSYNNFGAQSNFTKKSSAKAEDYSYSKVSYHVKPANSKKTQEQEYSRQYAETSKAKYGQYEKASKKLAKPAT